MPYTQKREKLYQNAIAFPATKTAGIVTLTTGTIYDFRDEALASAEVELAAVNASKVTDNLTFQPYVSFDKGTTWVKGSTGAYTDIVNSAGTASVTTLTYTSTTKANYHGKYFVMYDGIVPYFIWFDDTGSSTRPVSGVAAFDGAYGVKLDISAAAASTTSIGGAAHTAFGANATFTAAYGDSFSDPTSTLTSANKHYCVNTNAGNMLVATAVATVVDTSTQGVDPIFQKQIALAPTFRVDAIFDGTGALAAGHGLQVNVKMKELDVDLRKKIRADVMNAGGLVSTTTAVANTKPEWFSPVQVTDSLKADPVVRCYIVTSATDLSKITNTFNIVLQSSDDGNDWRASSAVLTLANGSGASYTVTEVTHASTYYLGKYQRVRVYSNAAACALATGHGIRVDLALVY